MTTTRQKKESILKDLKEQIKKAQLVVFVNFHGLSTSAVRKLRNLLRASSAKYQVFKKTLIKKAFESFDISGAMPKLEGETGLVFGADDVVAIAKILAKFIKEHKELSVLAGMIENRFREPKFVAELASLPPREVLLGKFVYIIKSPLQGLVVTLKGPIRNFVSVLSQLKK